MIEKRFATRYLLPLEMCGAWQLVCVAIAAMLPGTAIHIALEATGEGGAWGIFSGLVGVCGLAVSCLEWVRGRDWKNGHLRAALTVRKWISFFAAFAWIFSLYAMLVAPHGRVVYLICAAPAMTLFALWSWWANYRTECVLDPTLKTTRLERSLETRRADW